MINDANARVQAIQSQELDEPAASAVRLLAWSPGSGTSLMMTLTTITRITPVWDVREVHGRGGIGAGSG